VIALRGQGTPTRARATARSELGNRTSVTAAGKTVSYAYTPTNALASVTDWATRTTAYTYDDAGRPASVAYPNTIAAAYTIDRAGRVGNLAYTRSGSALASFGYTFNGEGQRLTETSPQGTTSYAYDTLGRLTGTTYPDTPAETFTYDAVGNRTTRTSNGVTTTYAYDDANELTSVTTGGVVATYTYDANGNRTRVVVGSVTTTYTYDTENRLTQLASGGNTIGLYAYDGAGNRVGKTAAGLSTAYSLDLASGLPQVLTETTGSAISSYAYAGGPLELDRSGTTYWYLSDTLGSVRLVTDSTGASPATYAYSAFGSTRTSTGTLTNEVRFSGERTDTESGLEFLRARTYDPSVGTFLQRDSWGITPTNSQSLDAYVYTANNPINATDPSGHCTYGGYGGTCSPDQNVGDLGGSTTRSGPGAYTAPATTIAKSGPGAYTLPATSRPSAPPSFSKQNSTPQGRPECGWNLACDLNNAIGTSGDNLNVACQFNHSVGAKCITDPDLLIPAVAVVVVIAGSVVVCNAAFEACAALVARAISLGGTVCKKNDQSCLTSIQAGVSHAPVNLTEALAQQQALADPTAGFRLQLTMTDPRWPEAGWVKMQQIINGVNVHYLYNTVTGKVDDPKIIGR
jgi:RHS repeat-associated protein